MQTDNFKGTELIELPEGFRAAGVSAGIKGDGNKDMAMLLSDLPAVMAGTFTANRCAAAPVRLCRRHLKQKVGRAIVVNSGVANAATGEPGFADALAMAEQTCGRLGVDTESVFICSTGSIGPRLPMEIISAGIDRLTGACRADGGDDAARAIMTTDTRPKRWTVKVEIDGRPVTVSGMAKGAGMIEPDMATMLAFIMTDAAVDPDSLQQALSASVDRTFNRITVDGDMSTNDTVLMMANGAARNETLSAEHPEWETLTAALEEVASRLAWMIVADGEGATKLAAIGVRNAASADDAERAARAVANSFLVKTAWAGVNPAVGRIVDALGYSGAALEIGKIDIRYDGLEAIAGGVRGSATDEELSECVAQTVFGIDIDLRQGDDAATVYTCNITEEYVRINM